MLTKAEINAAIERAARGPIAGATVIHILEGALDTVIDQRDDLARGCIQTHYVSVTKPLVQRCGLCGSEAVALEPDGHGEGCLLYAK